MKKNKKLFSIILGTVMAGSVVGIGNITKNASAEKAGVVLSAEDYTQVIICFKLMVSHQVKKFKLFLMKSKMLLQERTVRKLRR